MGQNRLGAALSPYLQDHAANPVDWWEWSPEALEAARLSNRPILLSIGYAACHWCHVMAHESFENPDVAALMNQHFVNVKVDREERPDIDQIYMSALLAMGEQGGWPMTMFLTPEGKPFYGGTYFPPVPAHGRPSFTQILQGVAAAWQEKQSQIENSADGLTTRLAAYLGQQGQQGDEVANLLAETASGVLRMTDSMVGGLSGAPKFPNAPYFEILLRHGWPDGPQAEQTAFLHYLRSVSQGGIYDHVGGGIHRYTVDGKWLVPHFEKMLYDNAHYLRHCAFAYRATGSALFLRRIEETVSFLERDMRLEGGGFAASLDADSRDVDGKLSEGAFYIWSEQEIDAVLGNDSAFKQAYGVTTQGNFEGQNILNRPLAEADDDDPFASARQALLRQRATRARPARDDKVLADWNALTIRALAEVTIATGNPAALRLAEEAFAFIRSDMIIDARLVHAVRGGQASGPALSGDYGALISAAVALFAATGTQSYLADAANLATMLQAWHADGNGGHWLTASDAADILFPLRGDQDDALPAATALVLEGLLMLAQLSSDPAHAELAWNAATQASQRIKGQGLAFPGITAALARLHRGSELAIIGSKDSEAYHRLLAAARSAVDATRLDLMAGTSSAMPSLSTSEPLALLCRDHACLPPIGDAALLAEQLRGANRQKGG